MPDIALSPGPGATRAAWRSYLHGLPGVDAVGLEARAAG
ncbi:deoxyribose-phosphate aldolase, partial [Streptomyces sp. PT12]